MVVVGSAERKLTQQKIVLQGFSGSGKTSVGKRLSELLSLRWVDVDVAIERKSGKSITEIIRVEGEDRFRTLESETLREIFSNESAEVISLGGGTLLRESNRALIRQGAFVVHLAVSPQVSLARIIEEEQCKKVELRPLLAGSGDRASKLQALYRERYGLYRQADLTVWTDVLSVEEVAQIIRGELRMQSRAEKKILIPDRTRGQLQQGAFEQVTVSSGGYLELAERVKSLWPEARKIALVVDENVFRLHGTKVRAIFNEAQLDVEDFILSSGEDAKNLKVIGEFASRMLSLGFGREDVVIGFGGGVVGDVSGLLASLYMRGVGLVHLPTTVVSQVDSALGGKTAVNVVGEKKGEGSGKNILGTFYPASLVVSDLDFLQTLPQREYLSGFSEVVKCGLIASGDFFEWLEKNVQGVLKKENSVLEEIVEFCSRTKLDIVREDREDRTGQRAFLNLGHTVGHAIESRSGFSRYLHGEAVAMGLSVALRFGEHLGLTQAEVVTRTETLLRSLNLPVGIPADLFGSKDKQVKKEVQCKMWEEALQADKKRSGEMLNFVFIQELGVPVLKRVKISEVVKFVVNSF